MSTEKSASEARKIIIKLFEAKVKGKRANYDNMNENHDGKEGHWLEKQFGIHQNANNAPDLHGFELKNQTSSKTSFGDWSASWYIFKCRANPDTTLKRSDFLKFFGKPNPLKDGRYSWSGDPIPKINQYNNFGQILKIEKDLSISIYYNYSKDNRVEKDKILPTELKKNNLLLAKWDYEWIKNKLEKKFNQNGWFKCLKNNAGVYEKIVFGKPINYQTWLQLVEEGVVIFDSGMYEGNTRNYSQWRANNNVWDRLIMEE